MSARTPNGDSAYRARLDALTTVVQHPLYIQVKDELGAVKRGRDLWRREAKYQRKRAELWRLRALRKPG